MSLVNRVGWDIGGAHVKAAVINAQGELLAVYQHPCPLWKGLDYLQQAARAILSDINEPVACHAITMTGELVDLFVDRNEGDFIIWAALLYLCGFRRIYLSNAS
jgi:uncharacterized hydantoinase/oxoprolinase family protein